MDGGTGVIDGFLNNYTSIIDGGFTRLNSNVDWLAGTLFTIDLAVAAMCWTMSDEEIVFRLVKKVAYAGFIFYLINQWQSLCQIIFTSFGDVGLLAGNSSITMDDLSHPSKIAQAGLDAAAAITAATKNLGWWNDGPILLGMYTAWAITIISFFILAVELFVILVEFKLATLAGFILIPFGLFGGTSFLAERTLGYVFISGIKITVLAIIFGVGESLFPQFQQTLNVGAQPNSLLEQAMVIALGSLVLLGLGIHIPVVAAGLASGGPQLSAGVAASTGALPVSAAMGAASVAMGGVQAAAGALGGTAAAVSGAVGSVAKTIGKSGGSVAGWGDGRLGNAASAGQVATGLIEDAGKSGAKAASRIAKIGGVMKSGGGGGGSVDLGRYGR